MSHRRALASLDSRSTLGVRLPVSIWERAGLDTPHSLASEAKVNPRYSRQIFRGCSPNRSSRSTKLARIGFFPVGD